MLTLREIHEEIETAVAALDELVTEIRDAGYEAAVAENAYRVANAKARLTIRYNSQAKVTVDQVEAEATQMTEREHLAYLISQSRLTTAREALRAAQAKLDGYRSLGASFRGAGG